MIDFWHAFDEMVATSRIKIDRPRGSTHPRYPDFIYPLDYGYLEGATSSDEGGIDVWIGSVPHGRVTALACCIDLEKRDVELKILLGCTQEEAREILGIHNSGSQSAMLIERDER
ncbi:MAG TPA: inorganic pyrophosphatase [Chloroflexia bacterium]|nr:inorganic pyrophosphatase [Chloroflexia bacterium]